MKIVVTTPTGNIGSKLAPKLLQAGADVTVLARNPAKVANLAAQGAQVLQGDQGDPAFLTRALAGADALFWLTPSVPGTRDMRGDQLRLAEAAAAAVRANRVARIVNLSSIGAQLPSGTGPIAGLHRVEAVLEDTGASIRHLRAAYFMENFLMSLETIRSMGKIFMPISGTTRIPMIATRDIADAAARILLDPVWNGKRAVGLHGPKDLSFDEAAAALGEGLGKPVAHVKVAPADARQAMLGMGASENAADLYLEMVDSMETGRLVVAEPRTAETTTPTTMATFAREGMKPLL